MVEKYHWKLLLQELMIVVTEEADQEGLKNPLEVVDQKEIGIPPLPQVRKENQEEEVKLTFSSFLA